MERGRLVVNDKTKYSKEPRESKEELYQVFTNYQNELNEQQTIRKISLEAAKMEGYSMETRLNVLVKTQGHELTSYMNYLVLIIRISEEMMRDRNRSSTKFMALIGSGYIPIYTPPTIGDYSQVEANIKARLDDLGVRYNPDSQYAVDQNRQCQSKKLDLWVSRIELCEKLGIGLTEFSLLKFLSQEVLPKWK